VRLGSLPCPVSVTVPITWRAQMLLPSSGISKNCHAGLRWRRQCGRLRATTPPEYRYCEVSILLGRQCTRRLEVSSLLPDSERTRPFSIAPFLELREDPWSHPSCPPASLRPCVRRAIFFCRELAVLVELGDVERLRNWLQVADQLGASRRQRGIGLCPMMELIDDAHLTEDGDGVQGPYGPQCLVGRILGTWLPL
jgi:hypothetical protein